VNYGIGDSGLWCTYCWPEREIAHFILGGMSVCEKCFEKGKVHYDMQDKKD